MIDHECFSREDYAEAASPIRARSACRPKVGLILGSGLNPLADEVTGADRIPYRDIPHFARPSVEGHIGQLVLGKLAGQSVVIMQGRVHAYEGHSPQRVTFPVRVFAELGVKTLIVTNAAGGIKPTFRAGDLMLIVDHIGLMAMTGTNPLWGPNDETLGPRFPAMNNAYTPELRRLAAEVAAAQGLELRKGVYVGLGGPTFESPAEVRFLRAIGGDAVGMSTVSEVIVARHAGMEVLGISGISNVAVTDPDAVEVANHAEVLEAGRTLVPKLMALVRGVLAAMPRHAADD